MERDNPNINVHEHMNNDDSVSIIIETSTSDYFHNTGITIDQEDPTPIPEIVTIDNLFDNLTPEQLIEAQGIISLYPGGNAELVLQHAEQEGITIIGWNHELRALEGLAENGETLYFMPRLGVSSLRSAERTAEDLNDGWTRHGGTITHSDGSMSINLFTSRNFEQNGETMEIVWKEDLNTLVEGEQANQDIIINSLRQELSEELTGVETINIALTAQDASIIGNDTSGIQSRLSELGYTYNALGFTSGSHRNGNYLFLRSSLNMSRVNSDDYYQDPSMVAGEVLKVAVASLVVDRYSSLDSAARNAVMTVNANIQQNAYDAGIREWFLTTVPVVDPSN